MAQIDYNNDTSTDIPFPNSTQDSEEDSTVEYYNDGNMDNQAFNDSMTKMMTFSAETSTTFHNNNSMRIITFSQILEKVYQIVYLMILPFLGC